MRACNGNFVAILLRSVMLEVWPEISSGHHAWCFAPYTMEVHMKAMPEGTMIEVNDDNVVITIPRNEVPVRPADRKLAVVAETGGFCDSGLTVKHANGESALQFSASVGFNPDKAKKQDKFTADIS